MKGTVKFYNSAKQFGFITPDDWSKDVFVHITGLLDSTSWLADGDKVEFEIGEWKKGPQAVNVQVI